MLTIEYELVRFLVRWNRTACLSTEVCNCYDQYGCTGCTIIDFRRWLYILVVDVSVTVYVL